MIGWGLLGDYTSLERLRWFGWMWSEDHSLWLEIVFRPTVTVSDIVLKERTRF